MQMLKLEALELKALYIFGWYWYLRYGRFLLFLILTLICKDEQEHKMKKIKLDIVYNK